MPAHEKPPAKPVDIYFREEIMKKYLILLMVFFLMGCQVQPLYEKENLKIVVASDIHYFFKDYYKDCEWFEESISYGDGKMVTYVDEILDAFEKEMKSLKPDIILFTGDLSFNGEKGSHEALAKRLEKIKESGIDIAVIPGNHDVDNIHAKGYGKDDFFDVENVDAKDFQNIYKNLGYNLSTTKHKESLSYRIDLNNQYSLLMMDSTAHEQTGSGLDIGGYFTESTYQWLENQLKDIDKNNRVPLLAMHHNLTNHNELLNQGYTIKDNSKIVQLFKQYQVPFVLSGHIHCQNIKEIEGIYDIATSSLLNAPLQYGIIDINNQKMNYQTQSLEISKDSNQYFEMVSKNRFSENFEVIKDKKVRQEMMNVMSKANRYYFTGNMFEHIDELKKMKGYSYFYKEEGNQLEFYKTYLESMMKETTPQQSLQITIP